MKASNTILSFVVFVALTVLAGYFSSVLVGMIGVTGNLVTIITFSLLYVVYTWLAQVKMGPMNYFMFIVQALGASMLSSWMNTALSLSDALLQSIIFSGILFAVIFVQVTLEKTPKKQHQRQQIPQTPKL